MTTVIIFSILVPLVVAIAALVYRVERRTEHISRIPLARLTRSVAGPDAARVSAELDTLLLLRRDGG